ncbi:hypothetical protein [Clostridium thermarum]|uniref:hypothetical protein n=1 Tax=Clostridium thermarum TaxID=1716543 RepID=UPI0013D24DE0|nr:hypothetical protein [Clostridium thermarum]
MLDGIRIGIMVAAVLVVSLEIWRFIRRITNLPREVEDLKRRLEDLEELVRSQNKELNG